MKLKVEQWPIDRLKNYPKNARTHSDVQVSQIAASIGAFGFVNPVLVDKTGTLIAGHGRVAGAREAGLATVPVIQLGHLTEDQARALRLADNRIQMSGAWDADLLRLELTELQLAQFDMPLLGFENYELADFMTAPVPDGADPEKVPPLPAKPTSRIGDLWILGNHRILCGDSTSAKDVARVMDGERAVLMNTDPPFGVDYVGIRDSMRANGKGGKKYEDIENDDLDGAKLQTFLEAIIRAALPHLIDNPAFYLWHPMLTQGTFFAAAAAAAADILIHRQIIWVKPSLVFGRGDYHWRHELCFYGWIRGKRCRWLSGRNQTTVWEIARENDSIHPTQKPVDLFVRPIENNSRPGEWIYEPFSGSGSQIIAAEMTRRRCAACELSPGYVDVAVRRWQEFSKQTATLAGEGRAFDEIAKARARTNGQASAQVRAARGGNGLRHDGVAAPPDARRNPTREIQHPHGSTKPVRMRKGTSRPSQKPQGSPLMRKKQKVAPPEPPQV